MKKAPVIIGLALFSVGALFGNATAGDPEPEFIKVPDPVTIHDTEPKTVTVTTPLNEHCKLAIKETERLSELAGRLYANGDKQIAILSDGRLALAGGTDTTPVDEEQRRLLGHEVGDLAETQDALTRINTEIELCNREQK